MQTQEQTKVKPNSVKVAYLKLENFMSVRELELNLKQINLVTGNNNEGKSTLLKAINFAVRGSSDASLVTIGEKAGRVILGLDDNTEINRRINSDGVQSVSVTKEGFERKKPQSFLEDLFDESSFNPLSLIQQKDKTDAILSAIDMPLTPDRVAELTGIVVGELPPLDYNSHGLKVIDELYTYFYKLRASANKEAAEAKKRWETYNNDLPKQEGGYLPNEEFLNEAQLKAQIELRDVENKLASVDRIKNTYKDHHRKIAEYENAVGKLKQDLIERHQQFDRLKAAYDQEVAVLESRIENGLKAVKDAQSYELETIPNVDEIEVQKKEAEEQLQAVELGREKLKTKDAQDKQVQFVRDLFNEFQIKANTAADLTERVEYLTSNELNAKLMDGVEMPVAGLTFKEGKFYVDSVAIENLSMSRTIKLAIAIARHHAKATKFINIDGIEQLDEESWKSLLAEIDGDGFTYFMTKVGAPFNATSENQATFTMKEGALQ